MSFDFRGRRAVVTGGANGIGLAAAQQLVSGGAEVWIFDREPAPAGFHHVSTDVADLASLEAAFTQCGAPDIVVANAGMVAFHALDETPSDAWRCVIDLNLTGVFHTVRIAARLMKPRRAGAIVLTASTNSYDGEATLAAYNASKAGVLGILHTAANELGPYGIRINAVCPGLIRTRLTQSYFDNPELLRPYFQHIPLGRGGEADEVGACIAFLASPAASFVTGATLLVDGGQMAAKFGTWSEDNAVFANGRWVLKNT